ncbi:MAG: Methionine aminotransferase [Fimbriimonadaceae bacterium]|nr:Methionine aminotransferase [Fimbriimonadaceae bacterium]
MEVQRVGGINLGQGVCNLPTPPEVVEAAHRAARDGENRYTHPRGAARLRRALAEKLRAHNGIEADPEANIMVSCGATGGFEAVCATLLDPGDAVVVFEPTYPYHLQALKRYGASIRTVRLAEPHWEVDWEAVAAAVDSATKFVLVNTPGNPTGKVWSAKELARLGDIAARHGALLVTDEIYEYMIFDGARHVSAASIPELKDRVITIGGYSKTFSITGWRIGYAVAPTAVATAMTAFLDAVYACAPSPLQEAVAVGVESFDSLFYETLRGQYEDKRDLFFHRLQKIGLKPLLPGGSYYMLAAFDEAFPSMSSFEFARHMIERAGVGAVPSDDFVRDPSVAPWVRFCLAQEQDVLVEALDRLSRLR